jgi:hypothetical protein
MHYSLRDDVQTGTLPPGQPTTTNPHNSHKSCVRVVSPDDGQAMPETCRDFEPQSSDSESEVCTKLVVFIT